MKKTIKKIDKLIGEYEENAKQVRKLPVSDLNGTCVFYCEVFVDELEKLKEVYLEEHESQIQS